MDIIYKQACSEVNYILNKLPEEEKQKIPLKFREFIENNVSKYYEFTIDFENSNEYQLKEETLAILAIIYRKYLASDEEKLILEKEYNEKLKKELIIEKQIMQGNKQMNYPLQEERPNYIQENEFVEIIKYEDKKWYKKIIDKLKHILNS